jgi:hypothetical protein
MEKLAFIEEQIREVQAGLLPFITCPYCGRENMPADQYLCCALFEEAASAIMDRIEKQEAIDYLRTVQDKVN